MKVIPLKKFGKYPEGVEFELADRAAKTLIKAKVLKAAPNKAMAYETRMMAADEPVAAPCGYKADGTPRLRPGRPVASE